MSDLSVRFTLEHKNDIDQLKVRQIITLLLNESQSS
jgi:hypothetical protein